VKTRQDTVLKNTINIIFSLVKHFITNLSRQWPFLTYKT